MSFTRYTSTAGALRMEANCTANKGTIKIKSTNPTSKTATVIWTQSLHFFLVIYKAYKHQFNLILHHHISSFRSFRLRVNHSAKIDFSCKITPFLNATSIQPFCASSLKMFMLANLVIIACDRFFMLCTLIDSSIMKYFTLTNSESSLCHTSIVPSHCVMTDFARCVGTHPYEKSTAFM